jgi:excisionase family DNA binding protein
VPAPRRAARASLRAARGPAGCGRTPRTSRREAAGHRLAETRAQRPSAEALVEALRLLVAELVREELARLAPREPSPYLSVEEAAAFLRARPQRIYDLLSDGRLRRVKDGARVLVARRELEAYLSQRGRG